MASLVGRQFLDTSMGYRDHDIDLYVPIFTLLQFFFYMGWLKVSMSVVAVIVMIFFFWFLLIELKCSRCRWQNSL